MRPTTEKVRDPRELRRSPDGLGWACWPTWTVLTDLTRFPDFKRMLLIIRTQNRKPKYLNNGMEVGTRVVFPWGKWTSVWYVYDSRVYVILVHSHQSYVEAIFGEELSVSSLGLRDGVWGMMFGLTSGWIGDPRRVGGPWPRRFRLLT
jgi:hypothetical protein